MNTNLKNSLLQTYISEADELNGNFSLPTIHQKWPQQYEFDITYMKKKKNIHRNLSRFWQINFKVQGSVYEEPQVIY